MKQIGLTLIAVVLIVTSALPANAAVKKSTIPSTTTFTMTTIPGTLACC